MRLDLDRLANLTTPLTRFFYAMLAVALISVLLGAPASGLFFLVVGALAHVLRAAIQELLLQRETAPAAPSSRRRPPSRSAPAPRRTAARSGVSAARSAGSGAAARR